MKKLIPLTKSPMVPAVKVTINIKQILDQRQMSAGEFAAAARIKGAKISRQSLYNLTMQYREKVGLNVIAAFMLMGVPLEELFTLEK